MVDILKELEWRGLLKQYTNKEKIDFAQKNNKAVYCGFDPTADSLHVGHLIQIINLKRFQEFGLKPIAIIGGATGMIGDPSFKPGERKLLDLETVNHNVLAIKKQLIDIIGDVKVLNNADWLSNMSLIDFLRFVGKDFNLSYLLAKENIATRIQTGLSITEFSYTMLQAYDFYNLYTNFDCNIEIGGSDQWGNITSGTDYISTKVGSINSQACGITMNLLTKKDGVKFGKTESGAVWLDKTKTSEYEFYQFFINQEDDECEKLLKFLTMLEKEQIEDLVNAHKKDPQKRIMQNSLANIITKFVHKEVGLKKAKKITKAFFENNLVSLNEDEIRGTFNSIPYSKSNFGLKLVDFLVKNKIASSNREAREFINSKAISINDKLFDNEEIIIDSSFALFDKIFIVKKGKRKYFAVEVE